MAKLTKAYIPNLLCALRITLIIPLWLAWSMLHTHEAYRAVFILFSVAALTDWLDGFLARKWQVQSTLGAMLDQIADKLLMISVLMMLLHDQVISATLIALLILREVWVSGLREYVGGSSKTLPVSKLGKWKTALQMIGVLGVLLSAGFYGILGNGTLLATGVGGVYILWASAALSWISAYQYSRVLWR